jgi:hypothetical protein
MGQPRVDPMATGQAPEHSPARGAGLDLGPWHLFLTIPEQRWASPAQCAARAEAPRDRGLALAVGALFTALVGRPHAPHGDFPHDMPALDVGFKGVPRSLTHPGQLIVRSRALHPHHEAIVALARIIEASILKQHGSGQGAQIDPMRPGPVGAGPAGGFSGAYRSDLALTHGRQQLAKTWALLAAGTPAPHVLIKHDDVSTPQATRVSGQRILPPLALLMVADLMTSRLAHIDLGRALPRRGTHLVAHGSSPCGARCG